MVGLWCLMMVVVVNAYTGTLTSRLAVPKLKPIIHNFDELAASPHTRVTIDANSALANEFLARIIFKNNGNYNIYMILWNDFNNFRMQKPGATKSLASNYEMIPNSKYNQSLKQ